MKEDQLTIRPAGRSHYLLRHGNHVLNMGSPAWHVEGQDDHPVSFDDHTLTR